MLRAAATYNVSDEVNTWFKRNPIKPDHLSITGRSAVERKTIHVSDVTADPDYKHPARAVETYRSFLTVPVLKGQELFGVISLYHPSVKPFTEQQIALVETFADRAAMAIENVRLLDELRQRTNELGRSVEELRALGRCRRR